MKYLLITLLLLPACGENKAVHVKPNWEIEERKIQSEFYKKEIDYWAQMNRVISIEEKDRAQKEFQDSLTIDSKSAVCQEANTRDMASNFRICFAKTKGDTSVHYNCFPTIDSYKCRLV